ncbi:unnamed protein product [Heligmosomoides polygyrus]|uniref:Saposin B-type domain-containing protein n=1 Tax=Heligmosomoides polygyrus TaxID=6339 RepID=A0A183FNA4_HELPZ|nr:unnamed protein product [Heligmosomoides polygyrus]
MFGYKVYIQTFSAKAKCDACKAVLGEVNGQLPVLTEGTETLLRDAIKKVCERYIHVNILEQICVVFEENVIRDLFAWIKKWESGLQPERECQYIHLCPRPVGFLLEPPPKQPVLKKPPPPVVPVIPVKP